MKSITEEMRYRRRLCEYAIKYGVTKAARRHHTNRKFVYRQLKKYDGSVRSLAMRSRKPHRSPNAHTEEELSLIKRILKRTGSYAPRRGSVCEMPQQRLCRKLRQYVPADTQQRLQETENPQEKL